MDILLVSVNRERTPYPVFPLGLACLAGPLTAAGHRLQVLDLCFADDPNKAVEHAMEEFGPKAVVISIRNIDNVTWPDSRSYLGGVKEVVARCRDKATVILGGSGFSLMPAEVLAFVEGDYGVVGEGEEVLPRLIAHLASGNDGSRLPGVIARGEKQWLPSEPVLTFGTPDRHLFAVSRYRREGGMANLQTKRGCPFGCIYCTYPLLEGGNVRLRPIAEIVAEIRELEEQYGVDYIYFVDDIFNYPPEFAEKLCRAMSDAGVKANWSAFINPGFVTPALLDAMVRAGCDAVEFGTDSGSDA
ncbi:MAG TPA: cobalamin-dependent protein, partial [Geobacteraceae bacterium]